MADRSLGFSVYALDKVSDTFTKIGRSVEGLQDKLQKLDRTKADPEITVETARAQRDIDRFTAVMRTKLAAAVKSLPEIEIKADSSFLDRELMRIKAKIAALQADVELGVDKDAAMAEIEMLSTRLRALGAQSADVKVRADIAGALGALGTVEAAARSLDGKDVRVKVDVDGAAGSVAKLTSVSEASRGASQGGLAAANSFMHFAKTMGLIVAVAGLAGPALGVVGMAIAALPAALFALAAPIAAVMVGLDGIQAAANGLMVPFGQMKLAVSATFERGLKPVLNSLIPIFPMLTAGLQQVALGLINIVRQTVAVVTSAQGIKQLQTIFAGVKQFLDALAPAIAIFVQNLLTMASVGMSAFAQLGVVFAQAATQFRDMLAVLIGNGQFQAAVAGFVSVMGALLTVLNQVIGVCISLAGQMTGPLVAALLALGNMIVAMQPLLANLGVTFLNIVTMIANAFVTLLPVITPLISVLLGLANLIIAQLLPPIIQLVTQLTSALMPVIVQLADGIGVLLVTALNAVTPILPMIVQAFQMIVNALIPLIPQIVALGVQLINILAPILPVVIDLFNRLLGAVLPLLQPLMDLISAVLPPLAQLFVRVVDALRPLADALINIALTILPPLVDVLTFLVSGALQGLIATLDWLTPLLGPIAAAFIAWYIATNLLSAGMAIVRGAIIAWTVVQWLLNIALSANPIGLVVLAIGLLIAGLILAWNHSETFRNIVIGAWNMIKTVAMAVFGFVRDTIVNCITTVIAIAMWFSTTWTLIWNVVSTVFSTVWNFIRNFAIAVWVGVSQFFINALTQFLAFWLGVWDSVLAFFVNAWLNLRFQAILLWTTISAYFQAGLAAFRALWGEIWDSIVMFFVNIWLRIYATVMYYWGLIKFYWDVALAVFKKFWSDTWDNIIMFFVNIWLRIYAAVMYYWALIKFYWDVAIAVFRKFWSDTWDAIILFFVNIWIRIYSTVMYYWALIKLYYDVAIAVFKKFWGDAWANIVGAFDRVWSTISGIATRVWDTVKRIFTDSINWVIDKINGFLGAINKVAGMLGFSINLHINRLGEGGAVGGAVGGGATIANPGSIGGAALGRAEGGPIGLAGGGNTRFRRGGKLPYTGKSVDTLPAMAGRQPYALMGQEYVVQRPAARALGSSDLNAVNNAHRRPVDVIPRASGGPVSRAYVPPDVAAAHTPFLSALASGQAEAVQAAKYVGGPGAMIRKLSEGQSAAMTASGGEGATMDGYTKFEQPTEPVRVSALAGGGDVANWARANQGGPYVWGGCSPRGSDCSGWVSALVNVARGNHPWSRLGSTGSFPWPGLQPGLTTSFGIGSFRGNPGHMAATIMGINAESGSGHGPMFGGAAHGANDRMFNTHASVPQAGGSYLPGPGGGGGYGIIRGILDNIVNLDAVRDELIPRRDDPVRGYGDRSGAGFGVKIIDFIYQKADELDAAMGGGMGASSNEAPGIVRIISDVAKGRFGGLARKAAVTGTATGIVESNLRNLPGGDRDSVGVFQQRPSMGWGTVQQCMNVAYAAGKFFSRFPGNWASQDQGMLAQSVQRSAFPHKYGQQMGNADRLVAQHGGFDNGGWLKPGLNMAYNGTGRTEGPVLPFTPKEWTNVIRGGTGGRAGSGDDYDRLAKTLAAELRADRSLIGSLTVQTTPNASAGEIINGVSREMRLARMGGSPR